MIYNDCIKTQATTDANPTTADANQRSDTQNSQEGGTYCCMECGKHFATHGAYILHLKEAHGI